MQCHEVDYTIQGGDLQLVEIELDPGETVIAEAGALAYMEQGIRYDTKLGDGSDPDEGFFGRLASAGKRMISGESAFTTHFTNDDASKRRAAFAASFPGRIVAVDMDAFGGEILCQKDAFLAAALGTEVDIALNKKLGAGFFGGEGFILQRLRGDGMAFLHAGGTLVEKRLEGETLRVDTGCIVGFSPEIDYDIQLAGGLKSMAFGGEGLVLATLSGTGSVYLQSMPLARLADRLASSLPSGSGGGGGVDIDVGGD